MEIRMFRPLFLSVAAALCLSLAGPGQTPPKKSALDKATLEAYVRHLFVMDQRISMIVGDPHPSPDLPGFMDVSIHATLGAQSQDFQFFVSKDGSKILQGSVFDINANPFKHELEKLKTEFEPSLGAPGADVVLVEFSDFQCPYCKEEATMIRQNLTKTYPQNVRLYFKTFPLESLHPWAKPAALASRCVFRQKPAGFWDFHDWVFEHQAEINPENFKDKVMEWAKSQKDLDGPQLAQCMDTKATEAEVDRDLMEGRALTVDRTPTLFVNGRRIGSTVDWPNLKSVIDYELEYQKTAKNAGENCGCDTRLNLPGMPQVTTPSLGAAKSVVPAKK
jgi:protein-disulfide isomerase